MQNVIAPSSTTEPVTRWWPRLLLGVVVSLLAISLTLAWRQPDTYTVAVLNAHGNALQGQSLFELNCAGCHGSEGVGRVGPSLQKVSTRRSDASLIEQVTSGKTLPMPQFQPNPQEMADLLSYLKTL